MSVHVSACQCKSVHINACFLFMCILQSLCCSHKSLSGHWMHAACTSCRLMLAYFITVPIRIFKVGIVVKFQVIKWSIQGILKGEASLVPLTSFLTGLDKSVLQIKTKIVSCHTADSKPVKQEVNGTLILPPSVFLGSITRTKLGQMSHVFLPKWSNLGSP
jgi:hypothetical protein